MVKQKDISKRRDRRHRAQPGVRLQLENQNHQIWSYFHKKRVEDFFFFFGGDSLENPGSTTGSLQFWTKQEVKRRSKMTKPDDEIISKASKRESYIHQKALIKIVVPLVGERLHHPPQMTLDCVLTWKMKRAFKPEQN